MKCLKYLLPGIVFYGFTFCQALAGARIDGASVGEWTMDYEAAVVLAQEAELPLLISFTESDICNWCELMDRQVFSREAWKAYAAENLVLVTIDFPEDKNLVPEQYHVQNGMLKELLGVKGFPTYLVVESDGETVLGKCGASRGITAARFIEGIAPLVRMFSANVESYVKAHPEQEEEYRAAIRANKAAYDALNKWYDTRPPRSPENAKIYQSLTGEIERTEKALADLQER